MERLFRHASCVFIDGGLDVLVRFFVALDDLLDMLYGFGCKKLLPGLF